MAGEFEIENSSEEDLQVNKPKSSYCHRRSQGELLSRPTTSFKSLSTFKMRPNAAMTPLGN